RPWVARADDRSRRAHAALTRPQEARGDIRPVRARANAGAACRNRGGRPRLETRTRHARAEARRDRVPEGGGRSALDATRRAVFPRTRTAELVRPHVGPDERRRSVVPARPDAKREGHA